jgi:hypothetical protein
VQTVEPMKIVLVEHAVVPRDGSGAEADLRAFNAYVGPVADVEIDVTAR